MKKHRNKEKIPYLTLRKSPIPFLALEMGASFLQGIIVSSSSSFSIILHGVVASSILFHGVIASSCISSLLHFVSCTMDTSFLLVIIAASSILELRATSPQLRTSPPMSQRYIIFHHCHLREVKEGHDNTSTRDERCQHSREGKERRKQQWCQGGGGCIVEKGEW